MNSEIYIPRSLTDKETGALITQIRKESGAGVKAAGGKTNGRNVVHVGVLGSNEDSRTISSLSEWEIHSANQHASRNQQYADLQETELIITHNGE